MATGTSPPKKLRIGGPEWLETGISLPKGPESLRDIFRGPREVFEILFHPETLGGKDFVRASYSETASNKSYTKHTTPITTTLGVH